MTTKAQAMARDKYNSRTKRFTLRFRKDELTLYEKLSLEDDLFRTRERRDAPETIRRLK